MNTCTVLRGIVSAHVCTVIKGHTQYIRLNSKKNSFRGNYLRKYGSSIIACGRLLFWYLKVNNKLSLSKIFSTFVIPLDWKRPLVCALYLVPNTTLIAFFWITFSIFNWSFFLMLDIHIIAQSSRCEWLDCGIH